MVHICNHSPSRTCFRHYTVELIPCWSLHAGVYHPACVWCTNHVDGLRIHTIYWEVDLVEIIYIPKYAIIRIPGWSTIYYRKIPVEVQRGAPCTMPRGSKKTTEEPLRTRNSSMSVENGMSTVLFCDLFSDTITVVPDRIVYTAVLSSYMFHPLVLNAKYAGHWGTDYRQGYVPSTVIVNTNGSLKSTAVQNNSVV